MGKKLRVYRFRYHNRKFTKDRNMLKCTNADRMVACGLWLGMNVERSEDDCTQEYNFPT